MFSSLHYGTPNLAEVGLKAVRYTEEKLKKNRLRSVSHLGIMFRFKRHNGGAHV